MLGTIAFVKGIEIRNLQEKDAVSIFSIQKLIWI